MRTRCWHHIWRGNVFSRKTLFYAHGVAKIQLNSTRHASKRGRNWVKSVEFRRKKWCRWCGKPFGIISEHEKKIEKFSLFWPPHTHTPTLPPTLLVWWFRGRKSGCISSQSTPQRLGLLPKTLFIQGFIPKIQLTPCENSMLTPHLTWKRIFEKTPVFWAWCGQNTAKFHIACLKKGSKLGEIGPISSEKVV